MKRAVRRIGIGIGALAILFILTLGIMTFLDRATEGQIHIYPSYPKEEISAVLMDAFDSEGKLRLDDQEYKQLLYQTGLGKPAVEELLQEAGAVTPEVLNQFNQFQSDFFAPITVLCTKIGIITFEEKIIDQNQEEINGFRVVKLKKGDILINKSSHSTGWRHGHNAIVIDAENQKTLEAVLLGYDSMVQSIEKWRSYPSFILLRLREDLPAKDGRTPEEAAAYAAEFAAEFEKDIPYGLLAGFLNKAESPEKLSETQCAHLVWYAYYNAGYDLDSDGGWLVTPNDIANSELLEIVQIYGVNPDALWP